MICTKALDHGGGCTERHYKHPQRGTVRTLTYTFEDGRASLTDVDFRHAHIHRIGKPGPSGRLVHGAGKGGAA